ncbi:MAG: signal peptidase I [Acidobacteriota bacterium]
MGRRVDTRRGALAGLVRVSILALWLGLFVQTFLVGALEVESASMEPALLPGDHVLVDRQAYRFAGHVPWLMPSRSPRLGDVVALRRPGGAVLVKRVVALPGDVVEIEGGALRVNGELSGERWQTVPAERIFPLRLRSREIFVLGDQRSKSRDSRQWGPAKLEWLQGRAVLIYWSQAQAGSEGDWDKIKPSAWERLSSTRWRRWLRPVR